MRCQTVLRIAQMIRHPIARPTWRAGMSRTEAELKRRREAMHRVFVISGMAALGLALLPAVAVGQQQQRQAPPAAAQAQPEKPLKDAVVGTWALLVDDGVKADGTHVANFGPNPEGLMILTADGHYSVQMMRTINRPKFASNNRTTGTADENK